MVFDFPLPTTSHLSFQSHVSSPTHASLPQAASTARHALRHALKKHKRLPPGQPHSAHLPLVLAALNEYIPYLFALSRGLSGAGPADEAGNGDGDGNPGKIEVVSRTDTEIEVSWRPTLNSGSAVSVQRFKRGARVKGRGIAFEMGFVLSTLGYVLSCVARTRCLSTIYAMKTPTAEEKTAAMAGAIRNLLLAASVHRHLAETATTPSYSSSSSSPTTTSDSPIVLLPPDLSPSTQSALSSLALAEATLLAVLKDDAYVSACIQARNPFDNEWMVKPPEIPKVRTLLLARLCVRAAEYAEQAAASAGSAGGSAAGGRSQDGVDEEVLGYMRVLGRVGRAKACRFFGVDAEMAGRVGEGIAWLRAGRAALGGKGAGASSLGGDGPRAQSEGKSTKGGAIGGGFSRLRREWSERREERKVEKEAGGGSGGSEKEAELLDWGDDAGREEEARVIDMLEAKWAKMNDTVNTQAIPSSGSYLSHLPSGRDIHSPPGPYVPPQLDAEQLARMRATPDNDQQQQQLEDASSSDEEGNPGYY